MINIELLKDLQNEILTQDKLCTAHPRYWVVQEDCERLAPEGCGEEIRIYDRDDIEERDIEDHLENLREIIEEENDEEKLIRFDEYAEEAKDTLYELEFGEFWDSDRYSVHEIVIDTRFVPNTFFLTMRDCKEHIRRNHYHYRNPKPYCMHAWRSPEFEKFLDIFLNIDLDKSELVEVQP